MEEQNLKRAETLYNKSILINGYPRQDGTNWDSLSSKMKTQGTSVFKRWYVMIVSFLFVFYRTRVRSFAMLVSYWLTNWLTHCCLVNLIDVTLACEDANSKLVDVVTVADVDAEDRVGNSLMHTWELKLGNNAKLLVRLWAQGLFKVLMLKFRQDF